MQGHVIQYMHTRMLKYGQFGQVEKIQHFLININTPKLYIHIHRNIIFINKYKMIWKTFILTCFVDHLIAKIYQDKGFPNCLIHGKVCFSFLNCHKPMLTICVICINAGKKVKNLFISVFILFLNRKKKWPPNFTYPLTFFKYFIQIHSK